MEKQKKIWLCEQYSQRLYTICMGMMQEAARAGEHGKGYAVAALETRNLVDRVMKYVELLRFESDDDDKFKGIIDCAIHLNLLANNTAIQAQNMVKVSMDFNIPKSMAVFADELRKLTSAFNELSGNAIWDKPFVVPEVAQPVTKSAETPYSQWETIFTFSIGGAPLCEDLTVIREIIYVPTRDLKSGAYSVRGEAIPILDCYKTANLPTFKGNFPTPSGVYQPVVIIAIEKNKTFALPIDDLDFCSLFHTVKGIEVSVDTSHPFATYTRFAWDAVGGGQLVFVDWDKLIQK